MLTQLRGGASPIPGEGLGAWSGWHPHPESPRGSWGCASWVESWMCCSLPRPLSTFRLVHFGILICVVKTRLVPNSLLTSVVLGGALGTDSRLGCRSVSGLAFSTGLRVDVQGSNTGCKWPTLSLLMGCGSEEKACFGGRGVAD